MAAAIAGVAVLAVETYRGTYNPIAMGMVVALLGITLTGTIGRFLLGRLSETNGRR